MAIIQYQETGRRKRAVARVYLRPGTGQILINKKSLTEFFPLLRHQHEVKQPLVITGTLEQFDVYANVSGGGITGQAEAIRHGLSRALVNYNPELRKVLKSAGFLTRDPREVERKKYGRAKARKRFQYSKR